LYDIRVVQAAFAACVAAQVVKISAVDANSLFNMALREIGENIQVINFLVFQNALRCHFFA
jgi:hypothetical protein